MRYIASSLIIPRAGPFILAQRKGRDYKAFPGALALFGGKAEQGENAMDCLQRELLEELSADIASTLLLRATYRAQVHIGPGHWPPHHRGAPANMVHMFSAVATHRELRRMASRIPREGDSAEIVDLRDLRGYRWAWGLDVVVARFCAIA